MTATELDLKNSISEDLNNLTENSLREIAVFMRKMVIREYIKRYGVKDLPVSQRIKQMRMGFDVNITDEELERMRYEYLKEKYK